MSGPIESGDFDPLRAPGSNLSQTTVRGPSFKAGSFAHAAMDNTAFFRTKPKGDATADRLIARGTSMKVVSTSGSYVKVELDSGEIGYVPSVMLEDPASAAAAASANEIQVYPPLSGSVAPLPPADPSGMPPEEAIPTIIDPEVAMPDAPVPAAETPAETFPAPPVAPQESVPLPPNGEELEGLKTPE